MWLSRLKWYLSTRKCDLCGKRKPLKDISFFSMAPYEQVCEQCMSSERSDI